MSKAKDYLNFIKESADRHGKGEIILHVNDEHYNKIIKAIAELEAQEAKVANIAAECTNKIDLFNKQMDELDDCDARYIRRDGAIDAYTHILKMLKDTK